MQTTKKKNTDPIIAFLEKEAKEDEKYRRKNKKIKKIDLNKFF